MSKHEPMMQQMSQTDLFFGSRGGCGVITQPINFVHDIYIDEPLENPSDWRKELHIIRTAAPGDVIHLHLNTPGGSIAVLGAFLKALRETAAMTIAHVEQECHSAGGPLLLACTQAVIGEEGEMMVHTAFSGYGGKHNNIVSHVEHSKKFLDKQFRKWYKDFLSEEEINLVLSGTDLWMGADEIVSRLKKRATIQKRPNEGLSYEEAKKLSKEEILFSIWPDEFPSQLNCEDSQGSEDKTGKPDFTGVRDNTFFVAGEPWFVDEDLYDNRATASFGLEREDCIKFFEETKLLYSKRESTITMNRRIFKHVQEAFGITPHEEK